MQRQSLSGTALPPRSQTAQTIRPAGRKDVVATTLQGMQPHGSALRCPLNSLKDRNSRAGKGSLWVCLFSSSLPWNSHYWPSLIIAHQDGRTFRDSSGSFRCTSWRDTQKLTSWCVRALTTKSKVFFFCTAGSHRITQLSLQRLLVAQLQWPQVGCTPPWTSSGAALSPMLLQHITLRALRSPNCSSSTKRILRCFQVSVVSKSGGSTVRCSRT